MNENGFGLSILINDNENEIKSNWKGNKTYLVDGTKYLIKLTNRNAMIVDAYLKIDGKKMGAYRMVPKESIIIRRPVGKEKDLAFVQRMGEHLHNNSYRDKEIGNIDVTFRSGVIFQKEKDFSVNNQVYRYEDCGYLPEYMNIHKRLIKEKAKEDEKAKEEIIFEEEENEYIFCDEVEHDPVTNEEFVINDELPIDHTEHPDDKGDKCDIKRYNIYEVLDYDKRSTTFVIKLTCKI